MGEGVDIRVRNRPGNLNGDKKVEPGRRRRNSRSENTVQAILEASEQVILESGVDRVSILDVCNVAGISRGTFYRYFASQDELLEAFSKYKRERFHRSLADALSPYDDPHKRFDALVLYLDEYLQTGQARKLLLVAPAYALGWFERIFKDSIERWQIDLAIVFDAWDEQMQLQVDRELVCELLIRYILSEQLVSSDSKSRKALPGRIRNMVMAMIAAQPAASPSADRALRPKAATRRRKAKKQRS